MNLNKLLNFTPIADMVHFVYDKWIFIYKDIISKIFRSHSLN
jgi:hypothetical protein